MLYDVKLDIPSLEPLSPRTQILFHAINKSGSEAVSNVLHNSFEAAGRTHRLHSHFRMPIDQSAFIHLVDTHQGGGLFIDHYLYGWVKPRANRVMISQFRHPLPRILSAYNWLKNIHQTRSRRKFKSLASFVRETEGKGHCLVLQFGANWKEVDSPEWLRRVGRVSAQELYERSLDALDRDLYAIGIAEHFEESLFLYAKLCGLKKLAPWVRDVRNPGRPLSTEIDKSTVRLIEKVLHYDYMLYEHALARFWKQFEGATFGPSLQAYKSSCSDQYNDRIVALPATDTIPQPVTANAATSATPPRSRRSPRPQPAPAH